MQSNPGLRAAITDRYVIDREVGAGGMANVYLAHDVRHDRRVALKVLRPELAAVIGAQRFLAEIRTTANLQHPHILPLYDSGEADGTVFYVMPYVDGESLRDRLNREKQLAVPDAVRIASEVADALDYAHRNNVVHRDIKPENILLHDGRALIADFGIALAVSRVDNASRMTETGMSLGTPHYMSPEQAMGERDITSRSDLYALGCVLYEMLVGEPPFTGPTAQAIVARVVTEQVRSIVAQRRTVPLHVETAVHRALEKLPADRFATAAAFAAALRDAGSTTQAVPVAPRAGSRRKVVLLGATAAVMTVIAAWGWLRPAVQPTERQYRIQFAAEQFPLGQMQLSASGSVLVYGGPPSSAGQQLFAKYQNKLDPVSIPGVENFGPFAISPDEKSVAYVIAGPDNIGALKRQGISGGTPMTLVDSALAFGVAWLHDGTLVYPRSAADGYSLWRVSSTGGQPTRLWAPDSTGVLALPSPGPDQQVFVVRHHINATKALWVVDANSGAATKLIDDALYAQWTASGYLVYGTADGSLLAVQYDASRRAIVGSPTRVLQNVEVWYGAVPIFALSESGTLVARLGAASNGTLHNAVFVDRDGRVTDIDSTWSFNPFTSSVNVGVSLSPDGTRIAAGIFDGTRSSIWIKPVAGGAPSRLTFDGEDDARPRWTPDGKAVTFVSSRNSKYAVIQKNVNGIGGERLIASGEQQFLEAQYSSDMQWLLVRIGNGTTHSRDLHVMRIGVDSAPRPLVATNADEAALALSPDGRWIAYQTNETGTTEVFIRPFPDAASAKWQVSRGGGSAPLWNPRGGELFFQSADREMMSVRVGSGESPEPTTPRRLFVYDAEMYGGIQENYATHSITSDGNRFLMLRRSSIRDRQRTIAVLENFLGR